MNWTKTIPTKPGAYWYRDGFDVMRDVVEIRSVLGKLMIAGTHIPTGTMLSEIEGEWSGPLVPVEEVEKAYWEGYKHGDDCLTGRTYTDSRASRVVEGKEI